MSKSLPTTGTESRAAPCKPQACGLLFLLAALTSGGSALAQDAPPLARPASHDDKSLRDFNTDCLRSGCHAEVARTQFVHAPVALGACASCHEAKGETPQHRFELVRGEKDFCSFCHRQQSTARVVHTAIRDGKCTACHDPHGGQDALYLKNADRSALCAGCHDARLAPPHAPGQEKLPFAHQHKPAAEGKCTKCHQVHQSDQPALLSVPERELCLKCHESVLAGLRAPAHAHKPLETGCVSCHSGHGGASKTLLRVEPREVCLGCHAAVLSQKLGDGSVHASVRGDASCLDCHVGHAGPSRGLVTSNLGAACQRCHSQEIPLADGRKLRDVQAEVAAAKVVHEPVARGECGACHGGHASPHGDLLLGTYPRALYGELSPSSVELCFGACHDSRLATEERFEATKFRDGDRNLHSIHTKGKKGRTCALCHEPHASGNPGLTRDAVFLGANRWRVAIGFRRTKAGGACASGCHQEMSYRNRP